MYSGLFFFYTMSIQTIQAVSAIYFPHEVRSGAVPLPDPTRGEGYQENIDYVRYLVWAIAKEKNFLFQLPNGTCALLLAAEATQDKEEAYRDFHNYLLTLPKLEYDDMDTPELQRYDELLADQYGDAFSVHFDCERVFGYDKHTCMIEDDAFVFYSGRSDIRDEYSRLQEEAANQFGTERYEEYQSTIKNSIARERGVKVKEVSFTLEYCIESALQNQILIDANANSERLFHFSMEDQGEYHIHYKQHGFSFVFYHLSE